MYDDILIDNNIFIKIYQWSLYVSFITMQSMNGIFLGKCLGKVIADFKQHTGVTVYLKSQKGQTTSNKELTLL